MGDVCFFKAQKRSKLFVAEYKTIKKALSNEYHKHNTKVEKTTNVEQGKKTHEGDKNSV